MEKHSILESFASNVRTRRIERGLSQEKLAEEAGLHRTYIGMIERCERTATIVAADKIAKALRINIKDLLQ